MGAAWRYGRVESESGTAATGHAGRGAAEGGMAGNSPQQDTYWKGVSGRRREGGGASSAFIELARSLYFLVM